MARGMRRAAAGAAVIALLAGCGGSGGNGESSRSALQILKDAKAATDSAPSVRLSGHATENGQTVGLDLVETKQRSGGTVDYKGATLHLVQAGGKDYLKAAAKAWGALGVPSTAEGVLANRWWSVPQSSPQFASFNQLFSVGALVDQLKPQGTLVKGKTTTLDGQSVIPLRDAAKDATLYVAATGKPYIVELSGPPGRFRFTQYGTAPVPAVPKGATSLAGMLGGGG